MPVKRETDGTTEQRTPHGICSLRPDCGEQPRLPTLSCNSHTSMAAKNTYENHFSIAQFDYQSPSMGLFCYHTCGNRR